MTSLATLESQGHLVDGRWTGLAEAVGTCVSPIDGQHEIGPFATDGQRWLERTLDAARRAQHAWRLTPMAERLAVLRAFADELTRDADAIARLISTEMGKTLAEARTEANALAAKIAITERLAHEELAPLRPDGVDGYATWRPLGVMAVIGPFNFPVHLSNGHIVPALIAGNAVVLKPSEVTPGSAERYAAAWLRAAEQTGAPTALIQLLQGGGALGAALAASPKVDAVAFTGSYRVGVAIRRACVEQTGKLLALEMGGKNTAIVLEDADVEATAAMIASAAFATTGQRCTATSRVLVAPAIADALIGALEREAYRWTPGDPFAEATRMGPLATPNAQQQFVAAQGALSGLRTVVEGGAAPALGSGCWVLPAVHEVVDVSAARPRVSEELFGPELLIERVSASALIARANATPYGLAMSVHTPDRERFEALRPALDAGLVNWNRPTAGASSLLPFGGLKHSGNLRPAGSLALRYCVAPVATMTAPG